MDLGSNALLRTLDSAGFLYTVRHTSTGAPCAGFRWECPPASSMLRSFTALFESDALRFTLHEPLGAGVSMDEHECFLRQREFPIARLYVNPNEGRKLELTIAILMHGIEPDITSVKTLLAHLAHNADDLLGTATGQSLQAPAFKTAKPDFSLADALRALGFHPHQCQGAFVVDMMLPALTVSARFQVYHLGVGWIRVSAHLLEGDHLNFDQLRLTIANQLQLWAPVGRFVCVNIQGKDRLGCEVASPFLGRSEAAVVAESMRAAILLLGTAYQQMN